MKAFIFATLLLFSVVVHAQKTAPLDNVLKQVTEALHEVETMKNFKQPKNVAVTFESETSGETSTGLKILIFSIGRSWNKAQSTEISYQFNLVPKESLIQTGTFKTALANAIRKAYDEMSKVTVKDIVSKGFTIKISFVIETSTNAGAEAEYSLIPLSASLGKSWKKKAIHTVELEF
ncbi:hypothetical protein ACNFU2_00830 [Chryseobacterium sp. PTM-20240506]|uniref:hypothetical protein n=1 Tax=unclassified Chryseobacterium TaxID=2593645 RepID=UPI0023599F2D|nr:MULTISPECIES: hypothetical protein [unclassified Chryseobacterium]MDC8103428.1 hypothetical protein [Chryseobacterium sp. B21-037]MDQ1802985.1 hypothetical protein [Chryseobacterium sp. CKR4-1]